MACKAMLSLRTFCDALEMFSLYSVQVISQQAHTMSEHFKCDQGDGGVNSKYYLISTHINLKSHMRLVAIWNSMILRTLFIFRGNTYA